MHPTSRTTSSSRSRHSHETRAPPEPSGSTRASVGFASPSAGLSGDAAASGESRANARAPMSAVNEEDKEASRVDEERASVASGLSDVRATRGADAENAEGASREWRVERKKPSDVPVSSETFRAAAVS